jgi:hypothetical protein
MTPFQSTLLVIFAVVAYMIIVDKNVGDYLILLIKMIRINIERFYWMIRFHPRNPITNLIMKWKYEQIAKDLEKELSK